MPLAGFLLKALNEMAIIRILACFLAFFAGTNQPPTVALLQQCHPVRHPTASCWMLT